MRAAVRGAGLVPGGLLLGGCLVYWSDVAVIEPSAPLVVSASSDSDLNFKTTFSSQDDLVPGLWFVKLCPSSMEIDGAVEMGSNPVLTISGMQASAGPDDEVDVKHYPLSAVGNWHGIGCPDIYFDCHVEGGPCTGTGQFTLSLAGATSAAVDWQALAHVDNVEQCPPSCSPKEGTVTLELVE